MAVQFTELNKNVINAGLCTHCGTCIGLSEGKLKMKQTAYGPLPYANKPNTELGEAAYSACPGKGINYPQLFKNMFGEQPESYISGFMKTAGIGYSSSDEIRLLGASGGVITQTLLYLLENKKIDGAIVVLLGKKKPWQAEPYIVTTPEEVKQAAQSVYAPIPVNEILAEAANFKGKLAYVGLPDQVASVRYLQSENHPAVANIEYIFGPYVGITMYQDSLLSYLRSNGYKKYEDIARLKYRDGEWPGYLSITTTDGKVLKAEKFYYNYLLPFYITKSTLFSIDFANDFADIAVGDAWHPKYEKIGKGFAVVAGRTEKGAALIKEMTDAGVLNFEARNTSELISMHGHMFDFKKRGAFIRMKFRKALGQKVPNYGIAPEGIKKSRIFTELIIGGLMRACSTRFARWCIQLIPISVSGRLFNFIRIRWKKVSKPAKRKGLLEMQYKMVQD